MLKLERSSDGGRTIIRLIGCARSEHLGEITSQMGSRGPRVVLDLAEVTVVDIDVVRFLDRCEKQGTELLQCPPYIREWIGREQNQGGQPMNGLLDLTLQAHGGLERWRQLQSLDVRVSLTGALYRLKGYPEGVSNVNMRIDTRRPAVTITPYSRPDARGHFTPNRVWIEDGQGRIIDERSRPRDSFAGHVLETPWDQLHRLYFTSYAMWNYLTTPFLLAQPGFESSEIETHQENGETWRCLQVRFPADVPTHNNEQIFHFNEKGLLQRLDYVAVRPAAHYCFDHTTFGGLVFPTLRRVVMRAPSGPLVNGPTAVLIQIADVMVA